MTRATEVRIGAIVLRGLGIPNPHRLGPAVAAELERLLTEGAPPAPTPPVTPERLAPGIAAAVHREVSTREPAP